MAARSPLLPGLAGAVLLSLALLLGGCTAALPVGGTPAAETAAPLPSATPTAAPSATPVPTSTPTPAPTPTATLAAPAEQPALEIPLAGTAALANAEISGLAWHGDTLVLLPQFPGRFGTGDGALLSLTRQEILAFLDGTSAEPLLPAQVPFSAPGVRASVPGFEGYEAIAFDGDRVYLTVEASPGGRGSTDMQGWLLAGTIGPEGVRVEADSLTPLDPPAAISNFSDEALLLSGGEIFTIYEGNGVNINPQPVARRFGPDLQPLPPVAFPNVEYRITDASEPDAQGQFWAINYFFPGEVIKLQPGPDGISARFAGGESHARNFHVERLLAFQLGSDGIELADSPPVYLQLLEDTARNWEGIVRLDERGFLLVTDRFPRTILAFVAWPTP